MLKSDLSRNFQVIIKQIREELRLSQQDFANKLGVSFTSVNRWENGRTEPTRLAQHSIYELAKASNVDVAKMVYGRIGEETELIREKTDRLLLYHGSKSGIKGKIAPISRDKCDFGKGFYMGTIPEQPLTLVCDYDDSKFYIVSINLSKLKQTVIAPDINWAFLVALKRGKLEEIRGSAFHRRIEALTEDYDVVTGSIADDRMFFVLDNFFQGNITDKALVGSLSALNLGQQVVAVTQKACDEIRIEKEVELTYIDRLALKDAAEGNRRQGITLANDICRQHRREGLFFDEILAAEKGV